jgi:N utilization substance protein B
MTKVRHRAREVALQVLYRYEVNQADGKGAPPQGMELAQDLKHHFDHFQIDDTLQAFAAELVAGTLMKREELDQLIESRAKNWKISRMALVDRCILRMALHEMRQFPDTPKAVVIDEAVELAKQFGTSESSSFVNGVLDAV